ncbi:hypothetical protein R6Q57_006703 [Mikania cordata]
MAGAMFLWALFQQWFPEELSTHIRRYIDRLVSYFNPYITIIFHEYHGDEFERSKAYTAIERYLSANTSTRAKRLKANVVKDCKSVVLSMNDYEEVVDEFKGIKMWWRSSKTIPQQCAIFMYDDEKRYYKLANRESKASRYSHSRLRAPCA